MSDTILQGPTSELRSILSRLVDKADADPTSAKASASFRADIIVELKRRGAWS